MMDLIIKIGRKKYTGWKSVSISKSMGSIAAAIQLAFFEELSGKFKQIWGIHEGDQIEVIADDKMFFKGYIDDINNSGNADSHQLTAAGRELTCDLVDCSHEGPPNEWVNISLLDLVTVLCEPFRRITVEGDPSALSTYAHTTRKFDKVVYQQGDSIFTTISKHCKMRGLLPLLEYDERGNAILWLTRAGSERAEGAIINGKEMDMYFRDKGQNALSWAVGSSFRDRFSKYIVKGQGNTTFNVTGEEGLETVTEPVGEDTDSAVGRPRPLIIVAEGPGNVGVMRERAKWEAMTRAGKSCKASYTIPGWHQNNGEPWHLNSLVPVRDDIGGVNADLLVDSLTQTFEEGSGTLTKLDLVHPDTYTMPTETGQASGITSEFDPLQPEGS